MRMKGGVFVGEIKEEALNREDYKPYGLDYYTDRLTIKKTLDKIGLENVKKTKNGEDVYEDEMLYDINNPEDTLSYMTFLKDKGVVGIYSKEYIENLVKHRKDDYDRAANVDLKPLINNYRRIIQNKGYFDKEVLNAIHHETKGYVSRTIMPIHIADLNDILFTTSPDNQTLLLYIPLGFIHAISLNTPLLKISQYPSVPCEKPPSNILFSPNGRLFAVSYKNESVVHLYDFNFLSSRPIHELKIDSDPSPIITMAFSPDGMTLATGSEKGLFTLWNVSQYQDAKLPFTKWLFRIPLMFKILFSNDGRTITIGTNNTTSIVSFNISWSDANQRYIIQENQHGNKVGLENTILIDFAFTHNGTYIVGLTQDNSLLIWDTKVSSSQPIKIIKVFKFANSHIESEAPILIGLMSFPSYSKPFIVGISDEAVLYFYDIDRIITPNTRKLVLLSSATISYDNTKKNIHTFKPNVLGKSVSFYDKNNATIEIIDISGLIALSTQSTYTSQASPGPSSSRGGRGAARSKS